MSSRIAWGARTAMLGVAAVVLAGCLGWRETQLRQAVEIARAGGLTAARLEAGEFEVLGFARPGPEHGVLAIYIEGDGHAWNKPWQPSTDPTPTDPVGLRLAAADPARPLLYLARPCQFIGGTNCAPRWWTDERLAPAVIDAFQQLVDEARARTKAQRVGLVGYSGGGALATLLAERRTDVAWLITVAGDLDLALWVGLHGVEPLGGSLDPAAQASAIARLPQAHLAGAEDTVVAASVVESFLRRLPAAAPARLIVVPGFDHECCWAAAWPRLLQETGLRR